LASEQAPPEVVVKVAAAVATDAEGNRYDIPDVGALDRASRDFLSQIL